MSDNYPYNLPLMDAIRYDYEQFRFDTHQYSHKGLFTNGETLFAVISEVKNDEALLQHLTDQYSDFHTLGIPTATIVGEVQENYKLIPLRNSLEKCLLHGQPMTYGEIVNQLNLHIPHRFHPFHFEFKYFNNQFKLIFKKEITENDKQEIKLICESIGYQGYDYVFEYNQNISDYPGEIEFNPDGLNRFQLPASGLIKKQFSKELLERYEEDEDFWLQNCHLVLSGQDLEQRDDCLLSSFNSAKTRCFVDASIFPRQNLRVYLTLYEQVIIALPLNDDHEYFYKIFKLDSYEFFQLINRGRLLFVAPQNLSRYSQKLLLDIISVNPASIIFSRRLAAATIKGIQYKSGIIGTTFSSDEQYDFLHHCSCTGNRGLQQLANSLSEQWQFGEYLVTKDGAVSAHHLGLSNMAIMAFKDRGKDLSLELTTASTSYEYAQGLNAHHFPFDSDDYSEVIACQCISELYNGVVNNSHEIRESELSLLLNKVLAINNDMSVLELDDALTNSLVRSLPKIVGGFSNLSTEQLSEKMYLLNKELAKIESNHSRLTSLDVKGYALSALSAATMESAGIKGAGYVTLGAWALQILLTKVTDSSLKNNPVFIKLSSMRHQVSQDAIIVKRVRDSISSARL